MVDILASQPQIGDYFSVLKVAALLVLVTPWLYLAPWVNKDTRRVRASELLWSIVVLGAGAAGLAVWLLMPVYLVGLMVFVVLAAATLGAYVVYRNGRVPNEAKVLTAEHLHSLFTSGKGPKIEITSRVKLYTGGNKVVTPPTNDDDVSVREAYNLTQDLLYDILSMRASEADMLPVGAQGRVRFIIDGVVTERPPLEAQDVEMIIQYLKPLGGMNAEERRRPQQGDISVDIANSPINLMMTTAGSTGGQRIQFKVVQEFVQTHIDLLGMTDDVLANVRKASKMPGMVIVAGRAGSGITSTLYSLLREQDAFVKQLVTLEAKPVIDLENVTQNAYGDPSKLTPILASTVRRDPDFVMIDRCEDPKSAAILLQTAASKTVLMGMQAGDSFAALGKWAKLCGNASAAVADLRGILCQMLVRKLCPACREAYRPDPKFLAKANLPAQKIESFYRPPSSPLVDEKGRPYTCPTCQGNGYFGRTGVFEWLEMTDEIRQIVAAGAPISQIQAACRKTKMLYLQEQALRKVIAGTTSIQEVIRVSQQGKKA